MVVGLLEEPGADEQTTAASLEKMPATSVWCLIPPLMRSMGLVECSFARWAADNAAAFARPEADTDGATEAK